MTASVAIPAAAHRAAPPQSQTGFDDSDSDDAPVGLPGDRDDDFADSADFPVIPDSSAAAPVPVPQAVGFEIVGFGTGSEATAAGASGKAPSQLIARLHRKTASGSRVRRRRSGDAGQQRKRSRPRAARRGGRRAADTTDSGVPAAADPPTEAGDEDAPAPLPSESPRVDGPLPVPQIGVGVGIEDQGPRTPLGPPSQLSPEEKIDCRNHVALFGEGLVRHLRSCRWQHRLEGLRELQSSLCAYPAGRHKPKVLELVVAVIAWVIGDSVFHVFQQAVSFWKHLLTSYVHDMSPSDICERLRPAVRCIVGRLGDINGRVRDHAHELLLAHARHPLIGVDFVAAYATGGAPGSLNASVDSVASERAASGTPSLRSAPEDGVTSPPPHTAPTAVSCAVPNGVVRAVRAPAGTASWKLAIGKLNLAHALLNEHGIQQDGALSIASVMGLAAEALNIANPKVRKTAASLVVEVYKRLGKSCEVYLRDVSASALKLLKQEIEIEICDVHALEAADAKGQEEEDMANLEPELRVSEAQRERLLRWQALLGDRSLVCLLSRKWKLRDNVFTRLRARVELALDGRKDGRDGAECGGGDTPLCDPQNAQLTRAAFEALVQIGEVGLQDSIPQLVASCCAFLRPVVELYGGLVDAEDMRVLLSAVVLPRAISQVSGGTTIVTQVCTQLLVWFASQPKLGVDFITRFVTEPPQETQSWKALLARLNLLLALVPEFAFGEGGMPIDRVMTYTVTCFQCANGRVRSAAVAVIIEAYKKCGNAIRIYLKHQKPALLQELKEKLAKVARKERTKTAPVHTLASIVQPLGVEDDMDRILPGRPSTFPTIEADAMKDVTFRERVAQWQSRDQAQPGFAKVTTLSNHSSWPSPSIVARTQPTPTSTTSAPGSCKPPLAPVAAPVAVVAPGPLRSKLVFS